VSGRAYIDTSAIIEMSDSTQSRHDLALDWLARHGDGSLIAHVAVISETTALLDRRCGSKVSDRFVDELLPSIAVFHGTEVANIRAMAAYRAGRGARRPSLTDCLSFETMREFEITQAFAFDQHFVDAGFVTVP
jgi:predicted nucleic acid-binding protein